MTEKKLHNLINNASPETKAMIEALAKFHEPFLVFTGYII